jgi:uncharacterized membrane protein
MEIQFTEVQFFVYGIEIDIVGILFRWMHILAAIAAVGGTIFIRLALMPSLSVLADDSRKALHEAIRSRWSKMVMAGIAFLLVSGLYNFVMTWRTYDLPGYYVPLFVVKVILAMTIFFIASALVGRSPGLEGIRRNARFWMTLNMTLAIVLVCISGVLRMAKKTENRKSFNAPAVLTQHRAFPGSEPNRPKVDRG